MKRAIIIFSILGNVGVFGGVTILLAYFIGPAIAGVVATLRCFFTFFFSCSYSTTNSSPPLVGFVLLAIGGAGAAIALVLGAIQAVRVRAWGWLVLMILAAPLGSLIYGCVGPFERTAPAMVPAMVPMLPTPQPLYPVPPQPPYQPPYSPPYQPPYSPPYQAPPQVTQQPSYRPPYQAPPPPPYQAPPQVTQQPPYPPPYPPPPPQ